MWQSRAEDDASSDVASASGTLDEVFPARFQPASAWTGDQLFLYGGTTSSDHFSKFTVRRDAALVDPATGDAVRLPDMDLPWPLDGAQAAVAGRKVVVTGIACAVATDEDGADLACDPGQPAGAVYDLDDRSWKAIAVPADLGRARVLGVTTTGRVVYLAFGAGTSAIRWYDIGGDRWESLAPMPSLVYSACMADDAVRFVVADDITTDPSVTGMRSTRPVVWSAKVGPAVRWLASPAGDASFTGPPKLECMDHRSVVRGQLGTDLVVYDATTQQWAASPPAPAGVAQQLTDSVSTGRELLLMPYDRGAGSAVAYRPATNTWRVLADPPTETSGTHPVWAVDAVVGYLAPNPGDRVPAGVTIPTEASVYRWVPD